MYLQISDSRLYARIVCGVLLIASLGLPLDAQAAGNARFELRPHCEGGNVEDNIFGGPLPTSEHLVALGDGHCRKFGIRDPENLQTDPLKPGDELDMDLVIINPDKKDIDRFRAWIAYDASALQGVELIVSSEYPVPTPGENVFSSEEGYIKVSGTAQTARNEEEIVVARIRMRASVPRSEGTPLTYFDPSGTSESKTGIFYKDGTTESNALVANPGYLFVRFDTAGIEQNASSAATTSTENSAQAESTMSSSSSSDISFPFSSSSSSAAPVIPSTVFTMLQVQGLRVTTEGSSVFLAWDPLPSAELVGYNVYYGTTTGQYIQRRGVDSAATTLTIRALPVGTTYYFAVRGVNGRDQETEFSQEVGISVGNPRTSTSPLTANSLPTGTPDTNGTVAGETGLSSVLLVFLLLSAVTGTFIAYRRQAAAQSI